MIPSNPVRLAVYGEASGTKSTPVLCVAFATSDVANIDEHFGSATRFATYRVFVDHDELVNVTPFHQAEHDGNEGKLPAKIAALEGCAAVFCRAVGGSAVRQLLAQGIQPIKVEAGDHHRRDAGFPSRRTQTALRAVDRQSDFAFSAARCRPVRHVWRQKAGKDEKRKVVRGQWSVFSKKGEGLR